MDCMEAIALKSSLRRDVSVAKSATQQVFYDDVIWCAATGEDFPIDDLLDFSNQDFVGEKDDEEEEVAKSVENDSGSISTCVSDTPIFGVGFADELAEPVDDMENLEWVSRLVDDSISEFPVHHQTGNEKPKNFTENRSKPGSKPALLLGPLCFPSTIPVKPRTKRPKPVGKVWSPELSKFYNPVQTMDLFYGLEKPPVKKQKKKPVAPLGETGGVMQFQRRCSHCQVHKTPQWRTGPHGAKTLCNACGVRFKSGRLYPEYRPACSPTFSGDIHSNSHRKVLEIRQKKDATEPESSMAQMVLTC